VKASKSAGDLIAQPLKRTMTGTTEADAGANGGAPAADIEAGGGGAGASGNGNGSRAGPRSIELVVDEPVGPGSWNGDNGGALPPPPPLPPLVKTVSGTDSAYAAGLPPAPLLKTVSGSDSVQSFASAPSREGSEAVPSPGAGGSGGALSSPKPGAKPARPSPLRH
jgi:hypothetical protein